MSSSVKWTTSKKTTDVNNANFNKNKIRRRKLTLTCLTFFAFFPVVAVVFAFVENPERKALGKNKSNYIAISIL